MSASGPSDRRPLSSWKDIAAHFARDVRTVQRWEKDEGLPVHRHPHKSRNSVYAYADELDAWWRGRATDTQTTVDEADGDAPGPSAAPAAPAPRATRRPLAPLAIAAALLAACIALLFLAKAAQPVPSGARALWRLDRFHPKVLAADIDGDGREEVVLSSAQPVQRVHRVTADGRLGPVLVEVLLNGPASPFIPQSADFNGDGLSDLLITSFNPNEIAATAPAFIVFGRRSWPARIVLPGDADVRFELGTPNDARLNSCGTGSPFDLNRDGAADVIFGATEYTEGERRASGAVFVLYGRRAWAEVVNVMDADIRISGAQTGSGFGTTCAAGDWDGDGWPDLAVQSTEATLWELRRAHGRTHVFRGGPHWPARLDAATDPMLRVDHPTPGSLHQQIALADVNGDGFADLVRSAPRAHGRGAGASLLRIWFGGRAEGTRTGADEDARVRLPEIPDAEWGCALRDGDFNADGIADVVIGEIASGQVWFVGGRKQWAGDAPLEEVGTRLLAAGIPASHDGMALMDLDGNGLPQVLVPLGDGSSAAPSVAVVNLFEPLAFDVRPGADRKLVLVPGAVAVHLSGARTDLSALDTASLRLNGAAPWEIRPADEDGDGKDDLRLYFESSQMALSRPSVTLTARRRDGRLVGGTQPVEVVRRAAVQ